MSDITVTVTDAGTGVPSVNVVDGSTFSTTVGNGGSVNVAIGDVTSGNATIVSGTLTVNSTTTLAAGSSAYAKNVGSAYAAAIDFGIPAGPATNIVVGNTTTLSAGSNASVTGTTSSGNLTLAFGIPRGATGATGSTGQNGVTPSIAIGNVSTLAAGSSATVAATPSNNGANVTLAFGLPRGATPSVSVGNVSTLAAGNSATVTGTSSNNGANLTLDFGIPAGVTPSFAVGNVSTVSAGGSATVTAKSSNGGANVTLDFGIPRGADGTGGGSSVSLSDAAPANLGTASAGTSTLASRSDHVHALPVISYGNLTGVPSNFPSNIASVSGLQSALDAKQAAGNYVTGVNNLTGNLTLAAGSNVTLTTNGSTLTLSASGGLTGNETIDGGDYVGQVVLGITFLLQPTSVTAGSQFGAWSSQTSPTNLTVSGLSYQNGMFFAIGTGNIARSANLSSWTTSTLPSGLEGHEMAYKSGGNYVVVGSNSNGALIASSTDGATWQAAFGDYSTGGWSFSSIAYGAGLFVAKLKLDNAFTDSNQSTPNIFYWLTSPDGYTWTQRQYASPPYRGAVTDVAFGGGVFVATMASGFTLSSGTYTPTYLYYMTSSDGLAWTNRNLPASGSYVSVTYGNGVFVMLPASGNVAWSSSDGLNWSQRSLPLSRNWSRVRWCGSQFLITSSDTAAEVVVSADGTSWTSTTLPSSIAVISSAGNGTTFLASGSSAMAKSSITAGSATLTVSATATGGGSVAYQWQKSPDAGTTWANIANATSTTLALSNLTTADNGTRYRAAASATGAATAYSQSATLTVTA